MIDKVWKRGEDKNGKQYVCFYDFPHDSPNIYIREEMWYGPWYESKVTANVQVGEFAGGREWAQENLINIRFE